MPSLEPSGRNGNYIPRSPSGNLVKHLLAATSVLRTILGSRVLDLEAKHGTPKESGVFKNRRLRFIYNPAASCTGSEAVVRGKSLAVGSLGGVVLL